jgi:hypothetical protein
MRIKEIIKKEVEEEVTKELHCDNCNINIEWFDSCGFGQAFTLSDAWCSQEGGKMWEFCSFKCLKEFVNNNELNEPRKLNQKVQEGK